MKCSRSLNKGARTGCKEALFSLGDQPERIFPQAREFLRQQGFARTLDYLAAMCELVLDRTGLLPHANPGVMDRAALERLKNSNASVGLMLETVSARLMRGDLPHAKAPDKVPAVRLRTIEEAGKLSIAFTTGILLGIGETLEERIDSLFAIRALHEQYGHIQEVIVQNFRAKPEIPMAHHPEPSLDDMLRTIAIARLILGPRMNLQAPPNLSYADFPRLAGGRHQRLGRHFAGHQRLHQSRSGVAANQQAGRRNKRPRVRSPRTPSALSGIR